MNTYVFDLEGSTSSETGLKKFVGERTYRDLTDGGQDVLGDQALHDAELIVISKYRCQQSTAEIMDPDWTDQQVIMAGLCYAAYQLYAHAENEQVAQDKREMGNNLLSSIIGICAFDIDQTSGIDPKDFVEIKTQYENPPCIVVSAPDLTAINGNYDCSGDHGSLY